MSADKMPEWVSIRFDGWHAVYHGGILVALGHPDAVGSETAEYLGSAAYLANDALGRGGHGTFSFDGDVNALPPVLWKYTDGLAPEVMGIDEYLTIRALVA